MARAKSFDPALGTAVHEFLVEKGVETPFAPPGEANKYHGYVGRTDLLEQSVRTMLVVLGLNPEDESLQETPRRVQEMFQAEAFYGLSYANFPKCTTFGKGVVYDEMVIEAGIAVKSFCEHHLLPFVGHATVGYIPKEKALGLSKLNRVVDFFCRRPQVQERLSEQIFWALSHILDTDDVAVTINAVHYCVKMRGCEDDNSFTVTSKLGGRFRDPAVRGEFMSLSRMKGNGNGH